MNKKTALKLLAAAFEDELAHLELRMIRDAQAPRFEALKDTHPEIYEEFMKARTGPHEVLLKNRRERVKILTEYIESKNEETPEENYKPFTFPSECNHRTVSIYSDSMFCFDCCCYLPKNEN